MIKDWYYFVVNWLPWNQIYDLKKELQEERLRNSKLIEDVFTLEDRVKELEGDLIQAAHNFTELKKRQSGGSEQ